MMARRSASERPPQPAISFNVRPQPMHNPLAPSIWQVFTHGLVTGRCFPVSLLTSQR